jgi:uncharacterized protein YyaL (SSP411 family)
VSISSRSRRAGLWSQHERLLAREKPSYDGAEPSGNSVALLNLLRLGEMTGISDYRARAERGFGAFARDVSRSPDASPKLLAALDFYLDRPLEVFVLLPNEGANADAMVSKVRETYLPNRVFAIAAEGAKRDRLSELVPSLVGKSALGGRITAFVCERGRCQSPTSDPEVFERQLGELGVPLR